jgi:Tetratricopeptide repeat/AAA ATPase domain
VDPTAIDQSAASTTEPHGGESPAQTMANGQIVVGNIPAQRPGFQPRPALLAQLNRVGRKSPAVLLTGPRGVGKTHLAAAYARARLAGGWRLIAWINAADTERLLAGVVAVAEAAVPPDDSYRPGPADAGQTLRHWLEADGSRCLLVFDDVEDLDLLRRFLPAAGAARLLITMARLPVTELGSRVSVDVFSDEEALALLDGRTGLIDRAGASAVATELGHLPLVLDQAAAVIAGQHLGYAAYLAKLGALSAGDGSAWQEDSQEQPYPPGVAQAVLLTLEDAWATDPVGVSTAVMEVMAMLWPSAVRCDLLRAAGQTGALLGGGRRVAASLVDQALDRLNQRSLLGVSLDRQAVSMHSLVARMVRDELTRRGRHTTACRAAASALELSAETLAEPQDHAAVREMLGQVTALLENAGAYPDDGDEKLASVLMRLRLLALERRTKLAEAYHAAHRTADAIPLIQRTLVDRERLLGADHPGTLASRNNLASAYRTTGRPAEAIPLFEENVAACERILGSDHPRTVASRHSLALAVQEAESAADEGPQETGSVDEVGGYLEHDGT